MVDVLANLRSRKKSRPRRLRWPGCWRKSRGWFRFPGRPSCTGWRRTWERRRWRFLRLIFSKSMKLRQKCPCRGNATQKLSRSWWIGKPVYAPFRKEREMVGSLGLLDRTSCGYVRGSWCPPLRLRSGQALSQRTRNACFVRVRCAHPFAKNAKWWGGHGLFS